MLKPRVLISRKLPSRVLSKIKDNFITVIRPSIYPMTSTEACESLEKYDAVIPTFGDDFSTDAIQSAVKPNCRILANYGAGYNNIDVLAARKRNIAVTNTPGAVTDATADIALALILMTARRTCEGNRMIRSGEWTGWSPTQLLGSHVTGQTLGIIGMGRIGRAIAHRCHYGFGMKIVFFNRSHVTDCPVPSTQLDSANEVCAVAKYIVMAVVSTPETHHFMNSSLLASMRKDGILINIARGDVIDEQALIESLKNGNISGAGLDVYEFEPHVPEELRSMNNVVLLPHLGTSVLSVREEMGMMTLANLKAYFSGESLPNPV